MVPAATLFVTFYVLFLALTPARYRKIECRKWPGALLDHRLVAGDGRAAARAIGLFGGYSLTYGSLAGVMIALLFLLRHRARRGDGAELNAALAKAGRHALKGEIYSGPYTDELEVEEPQPGEDVEPAASRGTATLTGSWRASAG
jgi:membrane protein